MSGQRIGNTFMHLDENGEYHRDGDLPAVETGFSKEYYKHGELHREGGPAIERADGTYHYYIHNKLHRIGAPAVLSGSLQMFYEEGLLHNLHGPAVYDPVHKKEEWWVRGVRMPDEAADILRQWCELNHQRENEVLDICHTYKTQ